MEYALVAYLVSLAWTWKQLLFPPKAQPEIIREEPNKVYIGYL